jgi:hypothetical protein
MNKLYRIKPVDKKSIYMVYECYKEVGDKIRWFNVRELYRWGQGFRELDDPVYAEDTILYIRPELGWGCELDDTISIDFEFDEEWTESEKTAIQNLWEDGDPEDPDGRSGAAWLYDYSDWDVEDNYVEILGPFMVDIIDDDKYNTVIEENIKLESRPKPDPNSAWPWGSFKKEE